MKITEAPTKIIRSFNGLEARTVTTKSGQTFEICTLKRYSGNLITTAQKNDIDDDGSCIISNIGETFLSVNHGKIRCTEKTVLAAHLQALEVFEAKIKETPIQEVKKEVPEVGDVVFLGGYGKDKGSRENNHIIYKIEGRDLFLIEKDTLKLSRENYVSDYKKRKGQTIGMYFEKGFDMSNFGIDENKLSDMLIEAQEVAKVAAEKQRIENIEAEKKAAEKKAYLSQFVQADRRKTTNIIKAHCLKTWKIAKIEVSTDVFSGGDSMDVNYYAPDPIKELESFINQFQAGHFNGMEDIYEYSNNPEIILDGHILQDYKYVSVYHKACDLPEPKKQPEAELINWDTIFDESEKSELFEIVQTKHTLKGFDLWVVKLVNRVSKDAFSDLLTTAKSFGGWYSAFNKNGAIPGFQFKDSDSASNFTLNLV